MTLRKLIDDAGGRKWLAFLLMYVMVMVFVLTRHVTEQTIIRDLCIGLLAVFCGGNVMRAWVERKAATPQQEQAP